MGELIFGLNPVNTHVFPGCAFSDASADWGVQNSVTLAFLPCILEYLPMPGSLSSNALETAAWRTHVRGVPVQDLLRDLFALKTPEYASWSPQDKLCEGSWRNHSRGLLVPADYAQSADSLSHRGLRYGYNCRTQAHNAEHAKKRNVRAHRFLFIHRDGIRHSTSARRRKNEARLAVPHLFDRVHLNLEPYLFNRVHLSLAV
jgi:hypothetical protein